MSEPPVDFTNTVVVKFYGNPVALELQVRGLIGGKTMVLVDESGLLELKVPAALWGYMAPGDHIHMTFCPVKVEVKPVVPILPGLGDIN